MLSVITRKRTIIKLHFFLLKNMSELYYRHSLFQAKADYRVWHTFKVCHTSAKKSGLPACR